ncbi:MAG: 3-deoxy-manno-octulosonate cytidylyltransferase [Candidatus Paracaedibacteraceae bacterium]|nr:3-deoxy-manno-octulosonate cytidylyltransferase [Candidatus Paracaedibacteraceae bacterium]
MKSILIIPSRLASTRLLEKPLHIINGKPLIQHVFERAKSSYQGRIVVACCDERVKKLIESLGGEAVLTAPDLPSGTDRIYEAYTKIGESEDIIINLQGDMAIFPSELISKTLDVFNHVPSDVVTAISKLDQDILNPSLVKVAFEKHHNSTDDLTFGRAHYFSRAPIPYDAKHFFKHIGIYIYTKKALAEFVKAPVSDLESIEKLEQLRGLALNHRYGATLVNGDYFSVDTIEDVAAVENYFK